MKSLRWGVFFIALILTTSFVFAQTFPADNVTLNGRWAYGPSYGMATLDWTTGAVTDHAFMGNGGYLVWLDITTPGAPQELAKIPLPVPLMSIAVENFDADTTFLYVADAMSGLRIIKADYDAGGPTYTLTELGSYDTQGCAYDVDVSPFGALFSTHFFDADTGWAVGFNGLIIRTLDGGATYPWTVQTSGTTQNLRDVFFIDSQEGWVVGDLGTALYTSNGGRTWYPQTSGVEVPLFDVHFIDANNGWAVGGDGTIIKTNDGGIVWTEETSGTTEHLRSVFFVDATNGWIVGDNGTILTYDSVNDEYDVQTTNPATTQHFNSVFMVNATTGWAVGNAGTVYTYDNVTPEWDQQTAGTTTENLNSVYMVDATTGWAVGDDGSIIEWTGADPWTDGTYNPTTTENGNSVFMVDATTGWIVGNRGAIYTYNAPNFDLQSSTTTNPRYAFVADGAVPGVGDGHVVVINVTDRRNPTKAGEHYLAGDAMGIAYASNHVYATYIDNSEAPDPPQPSDNCLVALNVTNPSAIEQVAHTTESGMSLNGPRDVVLDEARDYAYVADYTAFQTLDVTDLSDPAIVVGNSTSLTNGFVTCQRVDYDGGVNDMAYMTDGKGAVHEIDVSTPAAPNDQGEVTAAGPGWAVDLVDLGGTLSAVVSVDVDGFQIFSVPGWPGPNYLAPDDPTTQGATDAGVHVALPRDPTEGGLLQDVIVSGNWAYVADWDDGVRKIDVSVPPALEQNLANVAQFAVGSPYGLALSADGTLLYVASGSEGIQILKTADFTVDLPNYKIPTTGTAKAVAVLGNYAYVANGSGVDQKGSFKVIDINPASTNYRTVVGSFTDFTVAGTSGDHNAWDVDVVGSRAFVAVQGKGLWIFDVSTPTAPAFVDYIGMAGQVFAADVDILGRYAYVADGEDGLRIVDVNTSSAQYKQIVGSVTVPNPGGDPDMLARDAFNTGDFTYVAYGTAGLRIYNVTTPSNPLVSGFLDTGDEAYAVAVQQHVAYVADDEDGLYRCENDMATPTHFAGVVDPTGRSIPILIMTPQILGDDVIEPGDEIGIFDGTRLVGAAVYTGNDVTQITAWLRYEDPEGNPPLIGAYEGNKIIFKIWNMSTGDELGAFPTFEPGNDGTFSEARLLSVVDDLYAWQLEFFDPVAPTGQYQIVDIADTININWNSVVAGDEIAIFDINGPDTLCVGAAQYASPVRIVVWLEHDWQEATLPGAVRGNTLRFRVWDESANIEYLARPTYDDRTHVKVFGDVNLNVDRLDAYTSTTQSITIVRDKLNLISFNVDPEDENDKFVSSMLATVNFLQVCQDDQGNYYLPGFTPPIDQIGMMDLRKGYQVYYKNTTGPDPATQDVINDGFIIIPYVLEMDDQNPQLYMIGNPYQNPRYAAEVFAPIQSIIVVLQDDDGKVWVPLYDINTIDDDNDDDPTDDGLRPGKGYMIYLSVPTNYQYPLEATLGAVGAPKAREAVASRDDVRMISEPQHFDFTETGLPYPIVVTGSRTRMIEGDEIAVFDGDLCVGAGVYSGEFPMAVVAWKTFSIGENTVPGFRQGQPISIRVWSSTDGKVYDVPATFENDANTFGSGPIGVMRIGEFDRPDAMPTEFGLDQNYPNPFNPETTIRYQLPEASHVKMIIYNAMGQKVRTLVNENRDAGWYSVEWDGRDDRGMRMGSGIYFIRMRAGQYVKIHKMTLIQ